MQIKIDVSSLEKVKKQLATLTGPQFNQAVAETLNMVGGRLRKETVAEMERVFDRPTRYTMQSVRVTRLATAQNLDTTIAPTYMGGKGVDPQQFLRAQAEGGPRRDKRAEVLFRRVGILPKGMQMVIPRTPFKNSTDTYGNLKGSFIVQLISYFQAFGEQGFRANMKQRTKDKIADRRAYSSLWNKQTYRGVMGHEFFVVNRNGQMAGVHDYKNRTAHLEPGIWARSSRHGSTGVYGIWPVVMFTRSGNYKKRLDMDAVVQRVRPQELFNKWLRGRIRDAAKAAGEAA